MKQGLFFLLALLSLNMHEIMGQNNGRDLVIFEKFSGIYCGACPTAVNIIHDLMEDGAQIGVIAYQTGSYSNELYQNPDSDGMAQYYQSMVNAYPTTIIDGMHVPAWNVDQEYEDYYEERKNTAAEFAIDLELVHNSGLDYTINVDVEKLGAQSTGVLRVVLTETNIDQIWQGEEHLYDVCRKMLPDHNGTSLDINTSESFSFDVTMDPAWERDYCKIIAYVQNNATRFEPQEIFGAAMISFADNDQQNDVAIEDITMLNGCATNIVTYPESGDKDVVCGDVLVPTVRIRNSGNDILTSALIQYAVNNGQLSEYNWTGSLAPLETEEIELPGITFSPQASDNELSIEVSIPNTQTDEDEWNNVKILSFDGSENVGTSLSIEFRTDEWPSLNSWELVDSDGNIVEQSGSLSSYTVYEHAFDLEPGCYRFTIYDQTGNGFSNYAGEDGYFIFYNSNGDELVNVVDFGYEWSLNFSTEEGAVNTIPSETPWYDGVSETKKALFMNTTANWCTPCGEYESIFDEIYENHSGTICSVKGHVSSSSIGDPVSGDFHNVLNGGGGIPSYNLSGNKVDMWPPEVDPILEENEAFIVEGVKANIAFGYKVEGDQIIANATTKFFSDIEGEFFINIFILENNIEYSQSYDAGYETTIAKRVSRGPFEPNVENMWGENVGNGLALTGTTLNAEFSREIPDEWERENLELVAVIWHKEGDIYKALSAEDQPSDFYEDLRNIPEEVELNLFPNPVKDRLYLVSDREINQIEIFDLKGQLLKKYFANSDHTQIAISELKSGLYLVRVQGDGFISTKKIIVK